MNDIASIIYDKINLDSRFYAHIRNDRIIDIHTKGSIVQIDDRTKFVNHHNFVMVEFRDDEISIYHTISQRCVYIKYSLPTFFDHMFKILDCMLSNKNFMCLKCIMNTMHNKLIWYVYRLLKSVYSWDILRLGINNAHNRIYCDERIVIMFYSDMCQIMRDQNKVVVLYYSDPMFLRHLLGQINILCGLDGSLGFTEISNTMLCE